MALLTQEEKAKQLANKIINQMQVTILKPTKSAMQSGKAKTKDWLVKVNPDQTNREVNELMGWISADNTLSQLEFKFANKEEAIKFCETKGYDYEIIEPKTATLKPKSYAANFT